MFTYLNVTTALITNTCFRTPDEIRPETFGFFSINFCLSPMPPPVLTNFVVFPPRYGDIVANFWGSGAHEARLRCPNDVSGDIYTECNRRNVRDFGRVFLKSNYTDITQNTYIQIWTVTEILAREKCGLLGCRRTVRRPWCHTCPMRLPGNETW